MRQKLLPTGPKKQYAELTSQGKRVRIQKIVDAAFAEEDILTEAEILDIAQRLRNKFS
jgi:hypothetical protein